MFENIIIVKYKCDQMPNSVGIFLQIPFKADKQCHLSLFPSRNCRFPFPCSFIRVLKLIKNCPFRSVDTDFSHTTQTISYKYHPKIYVSVTNIRFLWGLHRCK